MRLSLYSFLLLITVTTASAQVKKLAAYQSVFDTQLKQWKSPIKHFSLAAFTITESRDFEDLPYKDTAELKEFYSDFKPLLHFSPDKKKFIDIYTYSSGLVKENGKWVAYPDDGQGITYYNKKTGSWKRIHYFGLSTGMEEVAWVSDTEFIMVGSNYDDELEKLVPVIWVGNISTNKFIEYRTTNRRITCPARYQSPEIKKLNVQGL